MDADNIPQGARILTVADKFAALIADRPYRRKLSPDQTIKILEDYAKQHIIDATILNALKTIISRKI